MMRRAAYISLKLKQDDQFIRREGSGPWEPNDNGGRRFIAPISFTSIDINAANNRAQTGNGDDGRSGNIENEVGASPEQGSTVSRPRRCKNNDQNLASEYRTEFTRDARQPASIVTVQDDAVETAIDL